jgi:hypothetical protein
MGGERRRRESLPGTGHCACQGLEWMRVFTLNLGESQEASMEQERREDTGLSA